MKLITQYSESKLVQYDAKILELINRERFWRNLNYFLNGLPKILISAY